MQIDLYLHLYIPSLPLRHGDATNPGQIRACVLFRNTAESRRGNNSAGANSQVAFCQSNGKPTEEGWNTRWGGDSRREVGLTGAGLTIGIGLDDKKIVIGCECLHALSLCQKRRNTFGPMDLLEAARNCCY